MGGKSSKGTTSGRYSTYESSSYGYSPQSYAQPSHSYTQPPTPQRYGGWPQEQRRPVENKFSRIDDNFTNLEQVTDALVRAGLESSNLIVGIDFTKSNEWTGARSFHRKCLHYIGDGMNPYEQAISIIGQTLSSFDEDNLIPCFGFGDASTHDQEVFSFYPDERNCNGFEEVLTRYKEIVPQLRLAGPTSFAPVIEMAMSIVEQSGGQYHVLLIIADGQVTRSIDTANGQLSPQEKKTVEAIVKASEYPLSIVLVGVGDGPWEMMKEFDDNIPARAFDNFQFVNFTEIMSKSMERSRKEAAFALAALMEIPSQYRATLELSLLGMRRPGKGIDRIALPPPQYNGGGYRPSKPSESGSSYRPAKPSESGSGYRTSIPSESGSGYRTSIPSESGSGYRSAIPSESGSGYRSAIPSESGSGYRSSIPSESGSGYRSSIPSESGSGYRSAIPSESGSSYRSSIPSESGSRPATYSNLDHICPICLTDPKNMAFGCGHQTCCDCGQDLELCPICRSTIATRIRLY